MISPTPLDLTVQRAGCPRCRAQRAMVTVAKYGDDWHGTNKTLAHLTAMMSIIAGDSEPLCSEHDLQSVRVDLADLTGSHDQITLAEILRDNPDLEDQHISAIRTAMPGQRVPLPIGGGFVEALRLR